MDFADRLEAQAAARAAAAEAADMERARRAAVVAQAGVEQLLPQRAQLAAMGMPAELLTQFDEVMAGLQGLAHLLDDEG